MEVGRGGAKENEVRPQDDQDQRLCVGRWQGLHITRVASEFSSSAVAELLDNKNIRKVALMDKPADGEVQMC